MGCTSSAPKTLSASANKKDKSIQIQLEESGEETHIKHVEAIDTETENRTELKVLPPSDTKELVQLVKNSKSTSSLAVEKDLNANGHNVENERDTSETILAKDEEIEDSLAKLKLEEMVGKFFEITHQDKYEKDGTDLNSDATTEQETTTGVKTEIEHTEITDEHEHQTDSEDAEEASPSQSQSSRATRWEALADIAAELPPSLAVDPITGQIYSHSK